MTFGHIIVIVFWDDIISVAIQRNPFMCLRFRTLGYIYIYEFSSLIISYHIILYYIILFYTILYYILSYYIHYINPGMNAALFLGQDCQRCRDKMRQRQTRGKQEEFGWLSVGWGWSWWRTHFFPHHIGLRHRFVVKMHFFHIIWQRWYEGRFLNPRTGPTPWRVCWCKLGSLVAGKLKFSTVACYIWCIYLRVHMICIL